MTRPHSAEQFGKQRDYWWNRDYVALLAERLHLRDKRSLADIGCGLGHWSSLLLDFMSHGSRLVGVDREQAWIERAPTEVRHRLADPDGYHIDFRVGRAESLPLGDDEFDVVTCQTLLMHLASPKQGLTEMKRIAKPGGLVLCVEPDNFLNYITYDSLSESRPLEQVVEDYKFWLCCHRGRIKAGAGNDSVGRLLPGLFSEVGLANIQVAISDKASRFLPPYDTPQEQEWLNQLDEWHSNGTGLYDFDSLRSYASLIESDQNWITERLESLNRSFKTLRGSVQSGTYHTANGGLMFIVWGEKPGK